MYHRKSSIRDLVWNRMITRILDRRRCFLKINIMSLFCIAVSLNQSSGNMTHGTVSGTFGNALCRTVIFGKVHLIQELCYCFTSLMPNNLRGIASKDESCSIQCIIIKKRSILLESCFDACDLSRISYFFMRKIDMMSWSCWFVSLYLSIIFAWNNCKGSCVRRI